MRSKPIITASIVALFAVISLVNVLFASSLTTAMPSLTIIDHSDSAMQTEIVSFPMGINVDLVTPEGVSSTFLETLENGDNERIESIVALSEMYTVENVSFSTHYELFNPSTTESVSSIHAFYSENGDIVSAEPFVTDPEQYTLVNVADYTHAGYSGDVVITADSSFTVKLITFPTANFSIDNITGLTVTYTNLSADYDRVLWDFGDGITSTVDAPVHTFEYPGDYMTTIKVTKLNCSVSIPECVSEHSDIVDLIKEKVFLPIVVTD